VDVGRPLTDRDDIVSPVWSTTGAVFNGRCRVVRSEAEWRRIPNALPSWSAAPQQSQHERKAVVFEARVHDRRMLPRAIAGRSPKLRAAIFDHRTIPANPERAGRLRQVHDAAHGKQGAPLVIREELLAEERTREASGATACRGSSLLRRVASRWRRERRGVTTDDETSQDAAPTPAIPRQRG
jgi:transposase